MTMLDVTSIRRQFPALNRARNGRVATASGLHTSDRHHPWARGSAVDGARAGVQDVHVVGVRRDGASMLGRERSGQGTRQRPFLFYSQSKQVLADTKLSAEAWD